jgi:hypothetical protein
MGRLLDIAKKACTSDQNADPIAAETTIRAEPRPWTADDAAAMVVTVLGRLNYQRERADLGLRPRIERLMMNYEPAIVRLLDQSDYESLRYLLIDLERNLTDAISGRGWN